MTPTEAAVREALLALVAAAAEGARCRHDHCEHTARMKALVREGARGLSLRWLLPGEAPALPRGKEAPDAG